MRVSLVRDRGGSLSYFVVHAEDITERKRAEARFRRADGEWRMLGSRAEPRLSPDGTFLGNVGLGADSTERTRSEQAIRDAREFAQAMIDALSSHICVLNESGTIMALNQAWKDFAEVNLSVDSGNVPLESAAGSFFSEGVNYLAVCDRAVGPDAIEAAEFAAGIRAVLQGERKMYSAEYPCHSPNEKRWFVGRVTRFSSNGVPQILIQHTNITERKHAELALQSSEERFRQLAENIREVSWMMPPAANEVLYVSPAYEQVCGRTCDSLYQDPMSWVDAIQPDDLERARKPFTVQANAAPAEEEFRIRTPDGEEQWIRDRAFPVRDHAGRLVRVVGISEDFTERKRYEAGRPASAGH